jgi:hypothetical protein
MREGRWWGFISMMMFQIGGEFSVNNYYINSSEKYNRVHMWAHICKKAF